MKKEYRKVSIDELRPGIYIGDVFNDDGRLLYSADKIIEGYHQIEALRRQGVATVFTSEKKDKQSDNIDKYADLSILNVENYRNQLETISEIKKASINIIKNLISSVKMGRYSTIASFQSKIEDIITEVIDNIDLFMALKVVHENENLYDHSINVAILMDGLADFIGYSKERVLEIAISGLFHDIGKIRLPSTLLQKETKYTRMKSEIFCMHPKIGVELIKRLYNDVSVSNLSVIAQHHERINGRGYPNQLKGDQILEESIICSLADMYDKLTRGGCIKKALLPQEALAVIFQGAGEDYPRELVEHFTKLLGIYPIGSFVKLESGEMGVVTKTNRKSLLTPQVMLFFNTGGQRIDKPFIRDLYSVPIREKKDPHFRISSSLNPLQFKFDLQELVAPTIF